MMCVAMISRLQVFCSNSGNWLRDKSVFSGTAVFVGGAGLVGLAVPIAVQVITNDGYIPVLPGGWMFMTGLGVTAMFTLLHCSISRLDTEDTLSHNALKKSVGDSYNALKASKATTATVIEGWAAGALVATIMSSIGVDVLSSLVMMGAISVSFCITDIATDQKITKWNYDKIADWMPAITGCGKGI